MRKKSCRSPSSEKALAAKTRNVSWVRPKIAGIESTANRRSARADGDQRDGQRGDEPLPVEPHGHPVGVVLGGGRQDPAGEPEDGVLLVVLVAVVPAATCLDPRGVDEDRAEEVEDPAEILDRGGADQDEDRPEDQREGDAEEQHLLLQLPGHAEARHDQHEDEEVVDRQALLGDVAGEVLAAVARRRRTRRSAGRTGPRCRRRRPTRWPIRAGTARAVCARGRRSRTAASRRSQRS